MIAPYPWDGLPRCLPEEAERSHQWGKLRSHLHAFFRTHATKMLGREVRLQSLTPHIEPVEGCTLFAYEAKAGALILGVRPALAATLVTLALGRPMGMARTTPLPEPIVGAVAAMLAHALRLGGTDVVVAPPPQAEHLETARFEVQIGDETHLGFIRLDHGLLEEISPAFPFGSRAPVSALPVRAWLAHTLGRMPAAEVFSLARGDVLVRRGLEDCATLHVEGVPGRGWRVAPHASGVVWTGMPMNEDTTREGFPDLQSIPLKLSVEVARVDLTIGRAAELAPGDVLTLSKPVGGTVLVRANERAIFLGELVDVAGELGVKLLRPILEGERS